MASPAFIDLLLASFRGQIIACNILDGIESGAVSEAFVGQVLNWWEHLVAHAGYTSPIQVVLALNVVRDRSYPAALPGSVTAPEFRFKGSTTVGNTNGMVGCVMPAGLIGKVCTKADRDRLYALGAEIPTTYLTPWTQHALDALLDLDDADRKITLDAGQSIGSNTIWVTTKTSLDNTLRNCRNLERADKARDILGLVHRNKDEVLAALFFPASILSTLNSARPTFVDAGDHSRFKTTADSSRARAEASWGWTANLEKLYHSKSVLDGCRERVCSAVRHSDVPGGAVSFIPLGILMMPRNDTVGVNDDRFAARLSRGKTVGEIRTKLIAVV